MPGGDKNQRNAGGLIEIEPVGNGDYIHRGHRNQFTVAAIDCIAQHGELAALVLQSRNALRAAVAKIHGREQNPLSGLEIGDVLAHLDNLTGSVSPQNMRQVHSGQPFAHPDVEVVQSAGTHAYEHLILT